ncbi:MAG: hypothetical protein WA129_03545 [Acidovorax sp.]
MEEIRRAFAGGRSDGALARLSAAVSRFEAYFTDGQNPGRHEVLARVAGEVGLRQIATKK